MSDTQNIAAQELRSFIERIERLEEAKAAISGDIKDVKGEAKGRGYDVTAINAILKLRKKDANERMEEETILHTYMAALGMIDEPSFFDEPYDRQTGEVHEINPRLAKQIVDGMQTEAGRAVLGVAVDIMIEGVEAEEQASVGVPSAAQSSVAAPDAEGSAASNSPVTASTGPKVLDGRSGVGPESRHHTDVSGDEAGQNLTSNIFPSDDDAIAAVKGNATARLANVADVETSSSATIAPASQGEAEAPSVERVSPQADEAATGSAAANAGDCPYEEVKTEVTIGTRDAGLVSISASRPVHFEIVPPVPMKSLPFAHCFPELSKAAYQTLVADIEANGIIEPIVRMGDTIVDGWNRYNAARHLQVKYPVTFYAGDDVLLDVIAWQRSSRDWTPAQEAKIAAALAKDIPHRADDIWSAFHIATGSDGEIVAA